MNQVDFNDLSQNLDTSSLMGCDSSFANIFLYQKKYNTSLQIYDNILFRYNRQKDGSTFFYFPIPIKTNVPPKNDESESFKKTALSFILGNFEKTALCEHMKTAGLLKPLKLQGGVLYIDEKPVAMTLSYKPALLLNKFFGSLN